MKYLVFIFLFGCGVTAQNVSEDTKEDQEFQKLLKKSRANIQNQAAIQEVASNEQKKIVAETVNKIVELKEENKDLKVELNETKAKLDSVSVDTLVPFVLLPIPR
jgi:CRISPR/Cas system CMR subunit Cmr4 (Cas7 group RAMP superfamily)